jgi:hypothetical protein
LGKVKEGRSAKDFDASVLAKQSPKKGTGFGSYLKWDVWPLVSALTVSLDLMKLKCLLLWFER